MSDVLLLRARVSLFVKLQKRCRQVISSLIRERVALRASYYTFSGEQELPDEQGSLFLSKETRISMERMQIKDKVSFMCVFEMSFQC